MLKDSLSIHLSLRILVGGEVHPAVDSAVEIAVVVSVDRPVPLPVQPGPLVKPEALPSAAGYQSPGRQGHGLWSNRQ